MNVMTNTIIITLEIILNNENRVIIGQDHEHKKGCKLVC